MIAAVIPTRYHPPELSALLRVLIADGVEPIVLRSEAFEHRIYRMWNVGVMEARALLGFLPSLSRRFFGEDLKMPNIATWWCGQNAAREEVLSRLDEVAIEGAYGRGVPGFPGGVGTAKTCVPAFPDPAGMAGTSVPVVPDSQ